MEGMIMREDEDRRCGLERLDALLRSDKQPERGDLRVISSQAPVFLQTVPPRQHRWSSSFNYDAREYALSPPLHKITIYDIHSHAQSQEFVRLPVRNYTRMRTRAT